MSQLQERITSTKNGAFYISIASLEMGIVSMKRDVVTFDEASLYLGLGLSGNEC